MGLFSSLGKIAGTFIGGPIGGQIGGAIGGAIDGRKRGGGSSTTSRTNFKQLRDDAAAAGFNPLTALRATGGRGNVTSTTNPILGSKQLLGDIIGGGISAAIDFDPFEEKRQRKREDLEDQLLEAELGRIQAQTGKINNSMFPPKKVETGIPPKRRVNMMITVHDPLSGRDFDIIDPDLTDSGPVEIATSAAIMAAADAAQNGVPAAIELFKKPLITKEKFDKDSQIANDAMKNLLLRGSPFSSFHQ